jgi:hypothetical protein
VGGTAAATIGAHPGDTANPHAVTAAQASAEPAGAIATHTALPNAHHAEDHAARHQHGGADEVAVATAAANAIPKALVGAVLDASWFSAPLKAKPQQHTMHGNASPYLTGNNVSYTAVAQFEFPGTNNLLVVPNQITAVISAASAGSTIGVQIVDVTNGGLVIVQLDPSATIGVSPVIANLGALSNLPANAAVFEIQLRKVTGGQARLSFIRMTAV